MKVGLCLQALPWALDLALLHVCLPAAAPTSVLVNRGPERRLHHKCSPPWSQGGLRLLSSLLGWVPVAVVLSASPSSQHVSLVDNGQLQLLQLSV